MNGAPAAPQSSDAQDRQMVAAYLREEAGYDLFYGVGFLVGALVLELTGSSVRRGAPNPLTYLLVLGLGWAAQQPHAVVRRILFRRFPAVYLRLWEEPYISLFDTYLRYAMPPALRNSEVSRRQWTLARALIVFSHLWTLFALLFWAGAQQGFPRGVSYGSYALAPLVAYYLSRAASEGRLGRSETMGYDPDGPPVI